MSKGRPETHLDTQKLDLVRQWQAKTTCEAEVIIARVLPLQLLRLSEHVDGMHLDVAAELSLRDTLCPTSGEPPSPRKKRKREADADVHSAGDAEFMPKTSPRVIEMQHHLKSELDLLSIYCNKLKLWLSLPSKRDRHPAISQAHADSLAEIQRAQECISGMRNTTCTYHVERLKLSMATTSSAELDLALDAVEERHLATLRQSTADLLSFYAILIDVLQVYLDQVNGATTRARITVFT